MTNITLVSSEDDWQGYYVNGRLVEENHRVDIKHFVEHLGAIRSQVGSAFEFSSFTVKDEWLLDQGRLPEDIALIPIEARLR